MKSRAGELESGLLPSAGSFLYTSRMAKALPALSALDYLAQPEKYPPKPVCVVFGDETFLRRQALLTIRHTVLGDEEGEFSLTAFEGRNTQLRDVLEELTTIAMFGGQRLVIVEEADDFVSRYREPLEDYVARPGRGILVLEMKSWPSNTRIYKAVAANDGFVVDCSAPAAARLARWLSDWAKHTHKVQLTIAVAEVIVELVGPELGLLDQEVARLALHCGSDKKITLEMVQKLVGSWRAKTTWEMLDAAMDGNAPEAIRQVDRLLSAGEDPIGLLAQISASLRRMAAATRLITQAEAAGRRIAIGEALAQAGVRSFVIQKTERQLRRLGRERGMQIYRWLLEADIDLKGDSAMPNRLILERLIVRLAAPKEMVVGAR